jgi:hypothetical protein
MRPHDAAGDPVTEPFADVLLAGGPSGPHARELMLFGRFIGSWDITWRGLDRHGVEREMQGELHFAWVLGGRAVQDVWIVPARGLPGEGEPGIAFHGSTLRFYDPAIGAWRSTWIEPVNGRVRRFIGRPVGDDIVLESFEDEPRLRWRFTDIADDRFRWVGEISRDGSAGFVQDEEMLVRRRFGENPPQPS